MPLSYEPGPTFGWQVRELEDLKRLNGNERSIEQLDFQAQALRRIREQLPQSKGLLGFVGGPLTLFFYATAGSHQADLGVAHAGLPDGRYAGFCAKLIPLLAQNMALQWRAGADCVAIFDTCAGELAPAAFNRWVVPQLADLLAQLQVLCPDARVLYYSKGTDARHWRLLESLPIAGIGIDWRTPIADALNEFGDRWAIQGNFDPHALLLPEADFLPGWVVERPHDRVRGPLREIGFRQNSSAIRGGAITLELIPSSLLTSARSCIVIIARSECASVRWPCWENMTLKSRSFDSRSYSRTLAP